MALQGPACSGLEQMLFHFEVKTVNSGTTRVVDLLNWFGFFFAVVNVIWCL